MTHGNEQGYAGANAFPLVERYMGLRLDADLSRVEPGRTLVVESPRRLRCEMSYGYVHALWWVLLADGRSVASVPPGAGEGVRATVGAADPSEAIREKALVGPLRSAVDAALGLAGLPPVDRLSADVCLACNGALARMHRDGECVRLSDERFPPAAGLRLPDHCLEDGVVFGVIADGAVASVAYAHRSGAMQDIVADIGVETAPAHRRKGYARTAVSHVVTEMAARGGEALYKCSGENAASIATAASAGFVPWGQGLVLVAPGRASA